MTPFSVVHAGGSACTAYSDLPLWLVQWSGTLFGTGSSSRFPIVPLAQLPQDAEVELRITHEGAIVEVRARNEAQLALYLQRPGAKSFEAIESAEERSRLTTWFKLSPRTDSAGVSWLREG